METFNITSVIQLIDGITGEDAGLLATIDGVEMTVPRAEGNRHYAEIMRQVEAGALTIQEADQGE